MYSIFIPRTETIPSSIRVEIERLTSEVKTPALLTGGFPFFYVGIDTFHQLNSLLDDGILTKDDADFLDGHVRIDPSLLPDFLMVDSSDMLEYIRRYDEYAQSNSTLHPEQGASLGTTDAEDRATSSSGCGGCANGGCGRAMGGTREEIEALFTRDDLDTSSELLDVDGD